MRDLIYDEACEVSGAGDVCVDYYVTMDELDDGLKSLSVLMRFVGEEEDILEAVGSVFM
jgi:hypothetical protein